ncbi:MAG TPA: hypothetical protein VIG25_25135 [Pyrinomonadaceae bacterium]|jgi:hypothetical protein
MKVAVVLIVLLATATFCPWHSEMTARVNGQTRVDEKEARTPAQRKIDSQLLYAIYQMRGEAEAKGVPTEPVVLRRDEKKRVLVDIRSEVTTKLTSLLKRTGSKIVSVAAKDRSVMAYVPLNKLERIADLKEVQFISQPAEATTN